MVDALGLFLFPEYSLYKMALKIKNKESQERLKALGIAWVVLKATILIGILKHFLTPYKLSEEQIIFSLP